MNGLKVPAPALHIQAEKELHQGPSWATGIMQVGTSHSRRKEHFLSSAAGDMTFLEEIHEAQAFTAHTKWHRNYY